jgi:hypothetical protein
MLIASPFWLLSSLYCDEIGPSYVTGVGTGVVATAHESFLASVTLVSVPGVLGWKKVRHGVPFTL